MSEVDTWRLQHCQHKGTNKDGHRLLLLKPEFIPAHVCVSPKTDRKWQVDSSRLYTSSHRLIRKWSVDCEGTVEG